MSIIPRGFGEDGEIILRGLGIGGIRAELLLAGIALSGSEITRGFGEEGEIVLRGFGGISDSIPLISTGLLLTNTIVTSGFGKDGEIALRGFGGISVSIPPTPPTPTPPRPSPPSAPTSFTGTFHLVEEEPPKKLKFPVIDLMLDLSMESEYSFIDKKVIPEVELVSQYDFIPKVDNIELLLLDEDLFLIEN